MLSATKALLAGVVILGLLALTGGVALAQGGGNSAGNSQYVDPLSGNGHHKSSSHSSSSQGTSTSSSSSSTTTTSTTAGSSTLSSSAPSSVAGNTTSSSTKDSSKALPFTGLNLWACVALGVGLLGAGLALRRALARAY
jgi:hypothetical protein